MNIRDEIGVGTSTDQAAENIVERCGLGHADGKADRSRMLAMLKEVVVHLSAGDVEDLIEHAKNKNGRKNK